MIQRMSNLEEGTSIVPYFRSFNPIVQSIKLKESLWKKGTSLFYPPRGTISSNTVCFSFGVNGTPLTPAKAATKSGDTARLQSANQTLGNKVLSPQNPLEVSYKSLSLLPS